MPGIDGRRHRADDRVGRERHLELLALEPAVEIGVAAPVRISIAFCPSVPKLTNARPSFASCTRLPGPERPGVGRRHDEGRLEEIGHALEHRLVPRQRLGVLGGELRDLAVRLRLVRARACSERPSGNGVNDEGLRGSISKPCRASSRSRMISGRSRLFTYAAVETL